MSVINSDRLPIGTIVKLIKSDAEVIIIGYGDVAVKDKNQKKFNYIGLSYPIGFLTKEDAFVFNTNLIEKILNVGYKDEKYLELINKTKIDKTITYNTEFDVMNDKLPVGSIISLVDNDQFRIMVIGYQPGKNKNGKLYDYFGVLYPLGFDNIDNTIAFNKDLIKKVYYVGYRDEMYKEFINDLKNIL